MTNLLDCWIYYNSGMRRSRLRRILKSIKQIDFFESVKNNELTPEQATELMLLRRESEYWIVRAYYYLESLLLSK